jgi:hypothetical protein
MLIFENSWVFSPNDVLAELEISVWGLKKATTRGIYSNCKLFHHTIVFYEMVLKLKEPLT